MTVSESLRDIHPERAVAINPWEPHNFVPSDPENGHLMLILYIDPLWFIRNGNLSAMHFGCAQVDVNSFIFARTHRIIELMHQGVSTDRFDGYLFELTTECFDRSQDAYPSTPSNRESPSDTRVCRSIELITNNLQYGMDLDEVARNSGLSRPHFFKLFRKQTGLTPNLFRNTLRMEKAIEWLTRSDRCVTNIGLDLGFSSQSSFTRFFASNVGLAPTEYRRAAHMI